MLTADRVDVEPDAGPGPSRWGGFGSVEVLTAILLLIVVFHGQLTSLFQAARLQTWATVFVSVMIQAMPFLVFGVLLSAVIAVYVPASFFEKVLPRRPALAVPVASAAGVILPGCECGSVPVAGALVRRGITPAAAFAFLLAAPAVNPIVLVSTAVAFPGQPEMVVARGVASLIVACLMGWLWLRIGREEWIRLPRRSHHEGSKAAAFWASCRHDVVHAGGFLVLGAMAAATINVTVPASVMQSVAENPVIAVVALAVLAFLLSICSEADAFVAASLTAFSPTAKLAFMVVGPMIDLKLLAMQTGTFGRSFSVRFAPTTFLLAVAVSAAVGAVLL